MAATGEEQWQALDAATAAISKFGPFKGKFSLERLVIKFRNDLKAFIEGTDRPKTAPLDFTKVDGNDVVSSIQKLFDQTTGQFSMGCIDLKADEAGVSADLASFYSERAKRVKQSADDKVDSAGDAASELYVGAGVVWLQVAVCSAAPTETRECIQIFFRAIKCFRSAYKNENEDDHWEKQAECLARIACAEMIKAKFPKGTPPNETILKADDASNEAVNDLQKA
jgi:hypothetical protein